MKINDLVGLLMEAQMKYGNIDLACPGDHQMLYKVSGVELSYVEDIQEYQMEEKHSDDIEDFIADGGNPTKVLLVYG